jgi:hypothetical protein
VQLAVWGFDCGWDKMGGGSLGGCLNKPFVREGGSVFVRVNEGKKEGRRKTALLLNLSPPTHPRGFGLGAIIQTSLGVSNVNYAMHSHLFRSKNGPYNSQPVE